MCKNVLGERCHIRNDNTEEKLRKHKLLRKWVNWQNWPELGLRDEGTRGLTVICTNGGATAGSITLYQTGPCWLNNNGISILAGPIFSSSFFSKIVSIWYLGVCLKLTIFSRPNIFAFFFSKIVSVWYLGVCLKLTADNSCRVSNWSKVKQHSTPTGKLQIADSQNIVKYTQDN